MTRICMIVQSLYPQDERVRRQAEALERESIPVDVICMGKPGQPVEEKFGLVTAWRVMPESRKESLALYIAQALRFAWAAMRKLGRLARERDYGLVQAHNMPDFLVFAAAFQKARGKPLILDLHDLTVELFGSKWGKRKATLFLPAVKLAEKISCGFADRLIATSHGFRDSLIRRGVPPEKITLVMNTADPHIFQYAPREFRPIAEGARLLYHGTVAERFGLAKAIDAVALLQEMIPGSTLSVYGHYDPSYKSALEEKIRALGLQDKVALNGWKSLEEIHQIICDSDLGVVPYLKDAFMDLALSTKTFEYTATGLPVVASDLKSIRSIFSDDCLSFADPASARDLAEKIAGLCLDPARRKRQVLAARDVLPSISGPVMAERYLGLVRELLDTGA